MVSSEVSKRQRAQKHLRSALAQYAKAHTELNFLTVVKTFEVLMEYEWRDLKRVVEADGLDAPSPKMAIKQAAKLGVLVNPEAWLRCLDARNNSVHDYFGIEEPEYLILAKQLLQLSVARGSP